MQKKFKKHAKKAEMQKRVGWVQLFLFVFAPTKKNFPHNTHLKKGKPFVIINSDPNDSSPVQVKSVISFAS